MEKAKKFLMNNVCFIIVFLVGAVYILTSFFRLGVSDKTAWGIASDGIVSFVLSTSILTVLRLQGLSSGSRCDNVISTEESLGEIVSRANPHINRLDAWCVRQNAEDLKRVRTNILSGYGMRYSDWFDEDGKARGFDIPKPESRTERKDWRNRKNGYTKAVSCKVTPLTTTSLTTCSIKENRDPHDMGRTKTQYTANETAKSFFTKILCVFVVGFFSVDILNFEWSNVIWKAFQFVFYVMMGMIQFFSSYAYMNDEYRGGLIRKMRFLTMFLNEVEQGETKKEEENGTDLQGSSHEGERS